MSDDILSFTAGELVAHYRSKRLSPVEVTRAALDRVAPDIVLVDLHAEATSEKVAMGWYLDGRVAALRAP